MKTRILIIAAVLCLSAFADTAVQIDTLSSVTVNGEAAGTVVDVLARPNPAPDLRAKLFDAMRDYETRLISRVQQKQAKDYEPVSQQAQRDITELQTKKDRAEQALTIAKSENQAAKENLASVLDSLRGVDLERVPITLASRKKIADALKSDTQKRKEEIQAAKSKLDEELAKLAGTP